MIPKEPRAGSGAIRDPRDGKQTNGVFLNPPRYLKMGGWQGPSLPDAGMTSVPSNSRSGKKYGQAVGKPMKGTKE